MARNAPGKCIAIMVGGAIGGIIAGGALGVAIEAIPDVKDSLGIVLDFAIPSVLGLTGAIGGVCSAWGLTSVCDKQPPDKGENKGSSDLQPTRSERQWVIIVWVVVFLAVFFPQITRLIFSPVLSKQAQLIVQIVMVAIAFCIWIIGTYWLYNQGVTARRRRQELSQLGSLEQIAQETQHEKNLSDETSVTTRLYDLCEGFLALRMKGQVATFHADWEKLKTLPLETLEQLGLSPAASQGLGFAGGGQQVLSIVSTFSWAVMNWPSLSRTNAPGKINTLIVKEAQARGCSDALSYALANYLQEQLTNS